MYKHLINLDNLNNIIGVDSILETKPTPENFIEFEFSEEQIFNPEQNIQAWGVFDPSETVWIPCYYYNTVNHQILHRPQADIDADIAAVPAPPPTPFERLESQIVYTAMMTDTLLEEE